MFLSMAWAKGIVELFFRSGGENAKGMSGIQPLFSQHSAGLDMLNEERRCSLQRKIVVGLFMWALIAWAFGYIPLGIAQRGYPVASFTFSSATPLVGESVTFDASQSKPDGGTLTNYVWDFGDKTTVAENDPITSHVYSAADTYTVTLVVVDSEGLWDAEYHSITVYSSAVGKPKASFTFSPSEPSQGDTVTFNASGSTDADGTIVSYSWKFGDSSPEVIKTDPFVTHVYATAGTYNVTLTVKDNDGLSDSTSKTVKVLAPGAPRARFTFKPENPLVDQLVSFNASLSSPDGGTIVSYIWGFGDKTSGTGILTTHTYTSFGHYQVTLTVTDSEGYSDSTSSTLKVNVRDVAVVSVTPSATDVYWGQVLDVTVVVRNEGTSTETYNVTLYYGENILSVQNVANQPPSAQTTLRFNWNTTGVASNSNYQIKAEVSPLSGETDTADNTYVGATVKVTDAGASTPQPFNWSSLLPFILPMLLGFTFLTVLGTIWKKRSATLKATGFEFFNEITHGGIPDGCSVMIIGGAGAGKSILCQELAHTYLKDGKACIYVTYDTYPDEIRKSMQSFNWDTSAHEKEGNFTFIDCYSSISGEKKREKNSVEQPFVLSDLGIAISLAVNEIKQKSPIVFIDSTAPLFMRLKAQHIMEFLQDRSAKIKRTNGILFFTVGEGAVPPELIGRLEEIVDCIIELKIAGQKEKVLRKMCVKKLRGHESSQMWVPINVEPGKGLTFLLPKKLAKKRKIKKAPKSAQNIRSR